MTPNDVKEAEKICKEAYFDMTVHPSEDPPLGRFMDEYVGHIEKRVAQAFAAERARVWRLALGAVPEKEIDNMDLIRGTEGVLQDCGWNSARRALIRAAASDGVIE
jgi:hypothetical protein